MHTHTYTYTHTYTRKLADYSSYLLRKQRSHSDKLHLLLKQLNKQLGRETESYTTRNTYTRIKIAQFNCRQTIGK